MVTGAKFYRSVAFPVVDEGCQSSSGTVTVSVCAVFKMFMKGK